MPLRPESEIGPLPVRFTANSSLLATPAARLTVVTHTPSCCSTAHCTSPPTCPFPPKALSDISPDVSNVRLARATDSTQVQNRGFLHLNPPKTPTRVQNRAFLHPTFRRQEEETRAPHIQKGVLLRRRGPPRPREEGGARWIRVLVERGRSRQWEGTEWSTKCGMEPSGGVQPFCCGARALGCGNGTRGIDAREGAV